MFRCIKPKKIKIEPKEWKIGLTNTYPIENHYEGKIINVPCGKCEYCRRRYAWIWATRCELETIGQQKTNNYNNYFLTLTFHNLPLITTKKQLKAYCLKLTQAFIKKIRNKQRKEKNKLKYIVVWELGEKTLRLHAHALIWGLKLNDKIYYGMSK